LDEADPGRGRPGQGVGGEIVSAPYSLLVADPTYGKPPAEFSQDSGWNLMYTIGRKHPEIEHVYTQRDVRTYRQTARNGIAEAGLKLGVTHILSLDDDHQFSGKDFTKLWNAMQTHPDQPKILSALYFTRSLSCAPCIFSLTDEGTVPIFYYPPDEVMKVDVIGFGFVIIDVEIFRAMGPNLFNLGNDFGEDAAVCTRMLAAGYPVYVHTGVKIGHILETPMIVDEAHYFKVREAIEHEREARAQVGEQVDASRIVPLFAGAGDPRGYQRMVPTAGPGRRAWWRPCSSRIWNTGRAKGSPGDPGGKAS